MRCPCCDQPLKDIKFDKRDNTVRPCSDCQSIIDDTVADFYKKDDPDAIIVDDEWELEEEDPSDSVTRQHVNYRDDEGEFDDEL